jgi:hypothetical protein
LAVRAVLAERQPPEREILRQRQPGAFSDLPPANAEFWNCSPPRDPAPVGTALDNAGAWVRRTVAALNLFQLGRLTQSERNVVTTALRENFHTVDPSHVPEIIGKFETIQRGLAQRLVFHCAGYCLPGDLAFVFRNPGSFGLPARIITICPEFFGCSPLKQASTIVHERAHEALGALDIAYEVESRYDSLAHIAALENADSYAVAARQIFHDGLHGPGLGCSILGSRLRRIELSPPTPGPPGPSPPRLFQLPHELRPRL